MIFKNKFKGNVIWIFCITMSCNENIANEKYSPQEIIINNLIVDSTIDISSLISDIKIIPIIEETGLKFNNVYKFLIYKNGYIIYDRYSVNKVFFFDLNGHFEKIICKVGTGANDPLNISDIWLNKEGNLEVYDFAQMKILKFDSALNFKSQSKSEILNHYVNIYPIPNSEFYAGYTNFNYYNTLFKDKHYSISILDSLLNQTHGTIDFKKDYLGIPWPIYTKHFFQYNDSLSFIKTYDNVVYDINQKSATPKYKIFYTKNNPNEKQVNEIIDNNLNIFKNPKSSPNITFEKLKSYTFLSSPWLESKNLIIIKSKDSTGKFGSNFTSIYNKKSRAVSSSFRKMIETKKFMMEIPNFQYYDDINKEYISVLSQSEIKNLLFSNSLVHKKLKSDAYSFYIIKIKFKIDEK